MPVFPAAAAPNRMLAALIRPGPRTIECLRVSLDLLYKPAGASEDVRNVPLACTRGMETRCAG